ncbi:MAG TPA: hypothetical protein VHY83_11830 [Solirubrobacteraceae bacterium]|jgi:hypothetical protein|nr:hypothetical protein [Solirubrobacteraceae bacterium]
MVAAELNPTLRKRTLALGLPTSTRKRWATAYGCLWLQTAAFAGLVACGGAALRGQTRRLLALKLTPATNPPPHLTRVLELAAHNIPIAAWPLLLGVAGAHRHPLTRRIADATLLASITINTMPVGAALGAHGTGLLPYIPQLPLEWAALALGASAWLCQRRSALTIRHRVSVLALTASILLCAAVIETVAVPHRRAAGSERNSRGGLQPRPIDNQGATHTQGARG